MTACCVCLQSLLDFGTAQGFRVSGYSKRLLAMGLIWNQVLRPSGKKLMASRAGAGFSMPLTRFRVVSPAPTQ